MDFHQLKIFAAVYRLKSFTGASKELNISQPTISEHIKNLEGDLNCKLFDRLGRSIMPTPEAEHLFPQAQQLLDSLNAIRNDLAGSTKKISGEISFGSSTIPGTYLIPVLAVEFKHKYPEVTFEVIIKDSATIIDMITHHEIYCGIVGIKPDSDNLAFVPFVKDELVLIASKTLGLSQDINWEELVKLPFLFREQGSGTRKCMDRHFKGAGFKTESLNSVATLASTAAVKEAARQGLGVTILSKLAVENELANGSLQQISITDLTMTREFYLVHHKLRTMPNRYQAFIKHLQNHAD